MTPSPSLTVAMGGCEAYQLLDSGDRYKLERFGPVTVIRGEPKAWWRPALPRSAWNRADAIHEEGAGWSFPNPRCPREFPVTFDLSNPAGGSRSVAPGCPAGATGGLPVQKGSGNPIGVPLTFLLRISDASKHLGLFPEQSPHWRAIADSLSDLPPAPSGAPPRLLNLFGYTGAASLFAARAGYHVTHVDASKPAIAWARENQASSLLADRPVRWILEDAVKYVRRELNRGSRYDAILLDPPAFGRGPGGGVWKVEHHLYDLLSLCARLLTDRPRLFILTTYNIEASALMLQNLLADLLPPGRLASGELVLPHSPHSPPPFHSPPTCHSSHVTCHSASGGPRLLPLSIFSSWRPS